MKTRQPKGIPAGGRFAAGSHDDAPSGLNQTISERMDAIRGNEDRRGEFSSLALANTASIAREIAPNATVLHLSDYRFALHVNSVVDANGERIILESEDYARLVSAIEEANPMLSIREGGVVHAEDPEGKDRKFFYDLHIDDAIASVAEKVLSHA